MAALTFDTSDSTGGVDRTAFSGWGTQDPMGLTDTRTTVSPVKSSDPMGLTDSIARSLSRPFSDTLGISDKYFANPVAFRDDPGLSDSVDFDLATVTVTVADVLTNPGVTTVTVAGGVPDDVVTINLVGYGSNPLIVTALDDGGALAQSVLIPAGFTGSQSLQVVLTLSGPITVAFDAGTAETPPSSPGAPTPPTPFVTPRWIFQDPGPGGISYTVPNNPAQMASPHPQRILTTDHSTSPEGQHLIWEGATRPYAWQFQGYCGTEAFYDALKLFADVNRRFYLIDHRSRTWIVSFDQFDATPRLDVNNPWAHDYTMHATIFGGPM